MKTSRLLVYGALGIITGLLFENKALLFKQQAGKKVRTARKQTKKLLHSSN